MYDTIYNSISNNDVIITLSHIAATNYVDAEDDPKARYRRLDE